VLVASIVSVPFGPGPGFHSAFLIVTLSAAGGAPGATFTVVVAVLPNHVAVSVTVVALLTGDVAMNDGVVVTLSSSNPAVVQVPSSTVVSQRASSGTRS
jgi:hypothetical protein